jgi:hypothetical protein
MAAIRVPPRFYSFRDDGATTEKPPFLVASPPLKLHPCALSIRRKIAWDSERARGVHQIWASDYSPLWGYRGLVPYRGLAPYRPKGVQEYAYTGKTLPKFSE